MPIVDQACHVARFVTVLGWEAAKELAHGTWRGWRADFLSTALVLIAEAERDSRILDQAGMWRAMFTPRGATE